MAAQDPLRWDRRYAGEAYAFGTAPNDFLVEVAPLIPAGVTTSPRVQAFPDRVRRMGLVAPRTPAGLSPVAERFRRAGLPGPVAGGFCLSRGGRT